MENFIDPGYMLFLAALCMIPLSLFVAPYLRMWITSVSQNNQQGYREHPQVMTISLVSLLMIFAVTPALAKDLFVLATDKGNEYFIVDSEIFQPKRSLTEDTSPMTLDFFKLSPNNTFTFRGSNIVNMAITLDSGFRTSLTNQLITIAGRIDWSSTEPSFKEEEPTRDTQALAYMSSKEQLQSLFMLDQITTMITRDAVKVN